MSVVTLCVGATVGKTVGVIALVLVGVGVAIEVGELAQDVSKAKQKRRVLEMTLIRLTNIKSFLKVLDRDLRIYNFNWHNLCASEDAKNPSSYSINVLGMLEVAGGSWDRSNITAYESQFLSSLQEPLLPGDSVSF